MKTESVSKIKFLKTTRFGNVLYHKGAVVPAPFSDDILAEITHNITLWENGKGFACTIDIVETIKQDTGERPQPERFPHIEEDEGSFQWALLPRAEHKGRPGFKEYLTANPEVFSLLDEASREKAIEKFIKFYPDDEIPLILRRKGAIE